jgi:hypothetical protein
MKMENTLKLVADMLNDLHESIEKSPDELFQEEDYAICAGYDEKKNVLMGSLYAINFVLDGNIGEYTITSMAMSGDDEGEYFEWKDNEWTKQE